MVVVVIVYNSNSGSGAGIFVCISIKLCLISIPFESYYDNYYTINCNKTRKYIYIL